MDIFSEFFYKNHRIGKSHEVNPFEIDADQETNASGSGIFVKCDACNVYMTYEEGMDICNGHWVCPVCGTRVREKTALNQIDKELDAFEESIGYGIMPEGCAACGGPWPDCKSSCSIYDD